MLNFIGKLSGIATLTRRYVDQVSDTKVRIYDNIAPYPTFSRTDARTLLNMREKIMKESLGMAIYEGRFGASPREVRSILYRCVQNHDNASITPMTVFEELRELVKDKSLYEFLQFESRQGYHDATAFISEIEDEFADIFEGEATEAMTLVSAESYDDLLKRYINHIVAEVKKERIHDPRTGNHEPPSEKLMNEVEQICGVSSNKKDYREGLIGRLGSWKLENKDKLPDLSEVYSDIYDKIKKFYYDDRSKYIQSVFQAILKIADQEKSERSVQCLGLDAKSLQTAEETLKNLELRFGYKRAVAIECLKFLANHNKNRLAA